MSVQETLASTAQASARGAPPRRRRGDLVMALVFIAPAALGFGLFFLWPALRGIYLSFTDYNLFAPPNWIGLANYRTALFDDPLFWHSMKVTLYYVVLNIGFQTVIAMGLAVLMHRLTRSTLIRGAILLPFLVANVIVALLWYTMLDYHIGIVNVTLDSLGIDRVAFFGNESTAIPTIAFVNVWRHMGYTALLVFAGLQIIPKTVYEAAAVDGSGEWRMFWRITLPLLRPVMLLVLVITVTGSFQVFDTVAVTTRGGPGDATRVIQTYIYDRAFTRNDFGYASALSMILFVLLGAVAWGQYKLFRGGESDLT